MSIQVLQQKIVRPALWGFFICIISIVFLRILNESVSSSLDHSWEQTSRSIEEERAATVTAAFQQRVNELLHVARSVVSDEELVERLSGNSPSDLVRSIEQLDAHRQKEETSIDLVDPRGTIIAWAGRSTGFDYKKEFETAHPDTFVFVSQADLHTYLSVGLRNRSHEVAVIASRPLEVNYPISNRFVSSASFADELSSELGVDVQLQSGSRPDIQTTDQMQVVHLRDSQGGIVSEVVLPAPTPTAISQSNESAFKIREGIIAALGILFLSLYLGVKVARMRSSVFKLLSLSMLLWLVRYSWKFVEFPSALFGGYLFDPSAYASPFGYGITDSVGETLISCFVLLLNSAVFLRFGLSLREMFREYSSRLFVGKKIFWSAVLIGSVLVVPLIIRGYGAAMRSFVFDSTLRYLDPTLLFPELVLLTMHLNIMFLSVSLLCLLLGFVSLMERSFLELAPGTATVLRRVWLFMLLVGGMILFAIVEKTPQVSYAVQAIIALIGLGSFFWLDWHIRSQSNRSASFLLVFTVIICLAFLISAPVLDAKLHDKERQRIQTYAEELLRPVDTWLSFVVSDDLRTVQAEYLQPGEDASDEPTRSLDAAFKLWARTLMGKEGYNSAVILYDKRGEEVSRFSVGLSSYEQGELLSRIFDMEEETLQLLERRVGGGTIKYYGVWGTLRRENGEVVGIVGLMLSASQRSLFRGEVSEPLRTISRAQFENPFLKLFISEYDDGRLTSTTNDRLFEGSPLPEEVLEKLEDGEKKFIWTSRHVQDEDIEVLYARDDANRQRVLAVEAESLDLRWHLFNFTKMFMVYALVLGMGLAAQLVINIVNKGSMRIGFREKLFASFTILTVVPLLLSGWYNKQLSLERLEENVLRELSQDLDLIQKRITSSVNDEYDFQSGVTDDYCEVIASDFAVDFSIYRQNTLHASSRPELYKAAILDTRLSGRAFIHIVVLGQQFFKDTERVGEVEYVVGYRPIKLRGSLLGVLAVPALYRQNEIDEEIAERNAFILGVYGIVLGLLILVGVALAHRFSRPLRDLSKAARLIGKGQLDVRVKATSTDEVGELVHSFNEMARELKQNRESLAEAERELAWKEMAKQVAHEIKNPLTPMKLSLQHLRKAYEDRARDFDAIFQNVSRTIMEQIDSLSRIASEFSNFARMPARTFSRVHVNEILQESINLFKEVDGVEFRANYWHTAPVLVADKDELRRVFINIIRNSVQAMEKGGIISVATERKDNVCIIRISDSGPGIPEEIRAKVFQPNFSTKTDGMGLGLAIAQKIIQDLNGRIELKSELGKGTVIEMRIPYAPGTDG